MTKNFEKIYQKIILFARLFNMQITRFEEDNENNIIRFYNNDELVGDIEMTYSYSYVFNFYPNILRGSLSGNYNPVTGQFLYLVEKDQPELTGTVTMKEIAEGKYQVTGDVQTYDTAINKTSIIFNYNNAHLIKIEKKINQSIEKVDFGFTEDFIILNYQKCDKYNKPVVTYLTIQFTDSLDKNKLAFEIENDNGSYKRYLTYPISKESELYDKLKATDLEIVRNNLTKKGKKLLKLIDSVRQDLTIQTVNGEVISLYDTMANLCFPDNSDPSFIFTVANPQQQEEKGKVLKRI